MKAKSIQWDLERRGYKDIWKIFYSETLRNGRKEKIVCFEVRWRLDRNENFKDH